MHLGILSSHPIQYQAPWFRELAREPGVELEVFFAHRPDAAEQGVGFGKAFDWDVDLLSGYRHRFLNNVARNPGVNPYSGCDTPEIAEIIGKRSGEDGRPLRFDAFIVTGWYLKCFRQAMRACRRAGIPVLVRGDSQLGTPRSTAKRLLMEVRQRWLLRKFDGFLTVGQRHREYLRHFGVPKERVFFAPHFVDNEWFAARAATAKDKAAELRQGWGARIGDVVALFVGKFHPKKRPADLLRAVARLQNASLSQRSSEVSPPSPVPRLLPVFVGSGELESALRGEAIALQVPAVFAGFKNQTELPACYAAADVLALPSDGGETWGLVVNEAMACGIPAIVSDAAGCAPDLIHEGVTGFTYPVGDAEALAHKLREFSGMRERGHEWQPALEELLQTYSVATAVRGTLEAIRLMPSFVRAN